jgi:malonyl-CoA/methylmalonyl-CoA synthetase
MANLLASLDLPAGARVAVQTEKSVEALMLYLAVLRAGLIYVPLNTAYQSGEMEYFIGDAEPGLVVCSSRNADGVREIARKAHGGAVPQVLTLDADRSGSLLDQAAGQSDRHQVAVKQTDEVAAIVYTSGTTGRSKGAMLTHGNLLSNARTLKDYWRWRSPGAGGDVLIHALPIFHVHGLFVASHGALISGSKMIWFARFDPQAVIARFPDATILMGVPTLYVRLVAEAGLTREACRGMRLFISGSAPLLIDTFNEFRERTGHTILERYGMSETLMLTSNPCDPADGERHGGTVGVALPGVGVRVRDDAGAELPAGEVGGIEVRGPNVFKGYWRMPEKTREEFSADGWFKTGDVGKVDSRGYVSIVGRSKDLIITGGYNVYPAEVEAVLNEMPGVAESAVIGVPHPDFGEGVVAVVVARPGQCVETAALVAGLKSKIANFKVPKRVLVVPELPRNTMGKVQKNVLREQHKAAFDV